MTINAYTRNFKKIGVRKALGSAIGISKTTTKLACTSTGRYYNAISTSSDNDGNEMLAKIQQLGQDRYLTALHSEGLDQTRYGTL